MNEEWVGLAAEQCYIQHLSSYHFRDWWEEDKRLWDPESPAREKEFGYFRPWHWEPSGNPHWWSEQSQLNISVEDRQKNK